MDPVAKSINSLHPFSHETTIVRKINRRPETSSLLSLVPILPSDWRIDHPFAKNVLWRGFWGITHFPFFHSWSYWCHLYQIREIYDMKLANILPFFVYWLNEKQIISIKRQDFRIKIYLWIIRIQLNIFKTWMAFESLIKPLFPSLSHIHKPIKILFLSNQLSYCPISRKTLLREATLLKHLPITETISSERKVLFMIRNESVFQLPIKLQPDSL